MTGLSDATKQENTLYVFNGTPGGIHVVHMPDCPTIAHQINEEVHEALPSSELRSEGVTQNGERLYREVRGEDITYFHATLMTRKAIIRSGERYRPCQTCVPPFGDHTWVKPIRIKAKDLKVSHIGKNFFDYGILTAIHIHISVDGTTEATLVFGEESAQRFNGDDMLSYERPKTTQERKKRA